MTAELNLAAATRRVGAALATAFSPRTRLAPVRRLKPKGSADGTAPGAPAAGGVRRMSVSCHLRADRRRTRAL